MNMTASLFDKIINTAQDCVFWKDKERRFVGVNQAFLDFYGFDSADVLIGKTDEDIGWHNDPVPFMQDELRVLEGESTYKVRGKCLVRGEERDIIASKRPIYEDGEIVGLVGSFVDVTDVMRRKSSGNRAQVIYTSDQLRKYNYFDKVLDCVSMDEILDPLTGIVSRAYILEFAKTLIAMKIPFSFTILDLDNFKFINDTYGHHAGDVVLMDVSRELANYTMEYGVVGRYGGDELLIINLRDIGYQERKRFFEDMFESCKVLRKNIIVDNYSLYITGTAGCASYPEDTNTYDELFSLIDKTLYRGKNKGRNCYIIYVAEKHKDIEINKIARHGVCETMQSLSRQFEHVEGFENKLQSVMPLLKNELQISDLYYVGRSGRMHSVLNQELSEHVPDIFKFMNDEIYAGSIYEQIEKRSPILFEVLERLGIGSVIIVRIGMRGDTKGYLICTEPRSRRIWQENESGILYFLAKQMSAHMKLNEEEIPE